jgi:hypothetical protein
MTLRRGLIAVAAVALVAVLAAVVLSAGGGGDGGSSDRWSAEPIGEYAYAVEMFENEAPGAEGRHYAFENGEYVDFGGFNTTEYNTNPPTSGKHVGQLVQPGFQEQRVPDEIAVHQMEHGFTVLRYNCQHEPALDGQGCNDLRSQVFALVSEKTAGYHVIGFPDNEMPYRVAITAWQFMDTMEEFDTDRLTTFIETFDCHYDPEGGC